MTREQRIEALKQAAKERILILDGAMGTMIQRYKLDEAGYRGLHAGRRQLRPSITSAAMPIPT